MRSFMDWRMQVKKTGGVHDVFLKKNSVTVSLMFKGIFEEAMLPHEISQIFTETHCAALIFAMTDSPMPIADPTPESIHFLTSMMNGMLDALSEEAKMEWQLVCTRCFPCGSCLSWMCNMHMLCIRLEHLTLELSKNWDFPPDHQKRLGFSWWKFMIVPVLRKFSMCIAMLQWGVKILRANGSKLPAWTASATDPWV